MVHIYLEKYDLFPLIIVKKNKVYLAVNTISLGIAVIGVYGTMRLNKIFITIHSLVTMSICGIFFLYSLMEALFSPELMET